MTHRPPAAPPSGPVLGRDELSIGELSRRTGVPIATIRRRTLPALRIDYVLTG